jgi:hypothetical protein
MEERKRTDIQESCIKLVNPQVDFIVNRRSPFGSLKIRFNDWAIVQPDLSASGSRFCLGETLRVCHRGSLAFSKTHTKAKRLTIGRVHTVQ